MAPRAPVFSKKALWYGLFSSAEVKLKTDSSG